MKRLSPREAQLIRLLVSAVAITRAELSREMGCREATVVKHLKRIFAKTGKKTTLERGWCWYGATGNGWD